jgi:hypothetical protein
MVNRKVICFDGTRPDIIILNKQQKQAYLLNIAVPNSYNITYSITQKLINI